MSMSLSTITILVIMELISVGINKKLLSNVKLIFSNFETEIQCKSVYPNKRKGNS